MRPQKNVLTTGEVAKICNVAPRTVSKWFDAGHLRGYRIPGSKDRRIPLQQLVRFMRAHGLPLNGLDQSQLVVLVFDADVKWCDTLAAAFHQGGGDCEVTTAATALEAGAAAQLAKPDVMVVDVDHPETSSTTVARFARSLETTPVLIGVACGLTEARGQALLQEGFDGYLSKPFDAASLLKLIAAIRHPTPEPSVN